jgi:hypothetical protein
MFYEPGAFLLELGVMDCTAFAFLAGLIRSGSTRVWVLYSLVLLLELFMLLLLISEGKIGWGVEAIETCKCRPEIRFRDIWKVGL